MISRRVALVVCFGMVFASAARSQSGSIVIPLDAAPRTQSAPLGPVNPDWGTLNPIRYNLDAFELLPFTSAATWSGINNGYLRYATNSTGFVLQGAIHLPQGAYITTVEVDYYDSSATGQVIASLGVCDYEGTSCAFQAGNCGGVATVCSDVADASGYGFSIADVSFDGITVDNFYNRYVIYAGNTTDDGSTAISKVIISYVLQVSPPPGSATFNDVPTSHPFFQYIEALAASGITGGCGSGNYCPDSPVTRGQMAVFLSKALGLNW